MNLKLRIISLVLISIFFMSIIGSFQILTAQTYSSNSTSYTVYYSKYDSMYISSSMSSQTIGMSGYSSNSTIYMVSKETYNSSNLQGNTIHVEDNYTTYYLTEGSLKSVEINYSISIRDGMFITVNSSPQLIRVLISTQGETEVVWAGYLTSTSTVTGYAYINNTAEIILQYANGTSILNITADVNSNSTISGHINTNLISMQVSKISSYIRTSQVIFKIPQKYANIDKVISIHNKSIGLIEKYNVSISRLNGTLVPAIYWNGSSSMDFSNSIPIDTHLISISNRGEINSNEIGFYGINGSLIAFISTKTFSSYDQKNFSILMLNGKIISSMSYTSEMIVFINGHTAEKIISINILHLNELYLAIAITTNGSVESTANVNFTHEVYISTPGILAKVTVNSTSAYIVMFKNNYMAEVHIVKPLSVSNTTLTYNSSAYFAQVVSINSTGYILFNVTLVHSTTKVIVVEKTINGLVQINSSNYFIINNTIEIFTDPYSTYYIIYPNVSTSVSSVSSTTTTSSSTTTTSSSTTTTSSSTTTSTSYTSTILPNTTTTSSTNTSTTVIHPPSTISSSTTSSKLNYDIIAGIIIVIIIAIIIVLLRRK